MVLFLSPAMGNLTGIKTRPSDSTFVFPDVMVDGLLKIRWLDSVVVKLRTRVRLEFLGMKDTLTVIFSPG
jgi:hypothetical protein